MRHPVYKAVVVLFATAMLVGLLQLPPPGTAGAVHMHVSADYVAGGAEAGGASNLVTAVLLNYRGLDTFGEVMVIFSALIAVLLVRAVSARPDEQPRSADRKRLPVSPVVHYVVRVLAPFLAAFALFVMISGDVLPGGGFQGGVMLAAMMILLTLALGRDRVDGMIRGGARFWVRAAAPLAFLLVAAIGLAATGWWFGLPGPAPLRHALMVALEVAIGIGGAAVLTGIFLALSED